MHNINRFTKPKSLWVTLWNFRDKSAKQPVIQCSAASDYSRTTGTNALFLMLWAQWEFKRAWEMAQQLRVLAALPKDPSSIRSTHVRQLEWIPGSDALFWTTQVLHSSAHTPPSSTQTQAYPIKHLKRSEKIKHKSISPAAWPSARGSM